MAQYADDCFFCELRRIFHFLRYGHPMKPKTGPTRDSLTQAELNSLFSECGIPTLQHMKQGQVPRHHGTCPEIRELVVKVPDGTENLRDQLLSSMRKTLKNHIRITKDVDTVAFTYGADVFSAPDGMIMLNLTVALASSAVVTE